ncbi:MAG: alkane 1-monooxygenase [Desulfobacteraceae bacterium]|nr:alkane 1-monooxygenase [Desulfobacteraceae bacterium]
MNILSFSMIYLVPVTVYLGYWLGGIYTFMTPFLVFGVGPLLDFIIGTYTRNPSEESEKKLEANNWYKMVTIFCAPIQLAVVFWGAYVVSYGNLSALELVGFILSIGISSDILGLSAAHELAHRINGKFEPMLSKILYCTVLYIHFGMEHVVGHHKRVATPEDPATARLGESFYAFLPRTIFGGFNSAWEFEAGRMKKKNKPVWSMGNPMAVALLAQTAFMLLIAVVFGGMGIFYLFAQSFIAIALVENANYVVHYGLLRKEIAPGKYEPIRPRHSWNSSNWLSNHFLFNIQRHSDHHYKPDRRYQLLRHYDEVPQLPTGYAGMIVLALIPPLWRKIMDPRVLRFRQSQND